MANLYRALKCAAPTEAAELIRRACAIQPPTPALSAAEGYVFNPPERPLWR